MRSPPSVAFVLPGQSDVPIGGFKVVYEYANGLARRGHPVTVVHPVDTGRDRSLLERGWRAWRYGKRILRGTHRSAGWFPLDPAVRVAWVPSLHPRWIPEADATVATAWDTAAWVARARPAGGRKLYLIQHIETWAGTEEQVIATWRLPLRKIVIARWLQDFGRGIGVESDYIPNGLDFAAFGLDVALERRDAARVAMLYHELDWKGSRDGLRALELARRQRPDLTATLFGVPPAPAGLPAWVRYHRSPTQLQLRRLYNEAAVFLAPSWAEGWPLPPAEAMACGAALVATDIGGHREYAHHERTALLSPPKDPSALADNLSRLLARPEARLELARRGHAHIHEFTWSRAVDAFKRSAFVEAGR